MLKTFSLLQISFFLFCGLLVANSNTTIDRQVPQPSLDDKQDCFNHFELVQDKANQLWESFQEGKQFVPFKIGRSAKDLKEEFENIRTTRVSMYATAEYQLAEQLLDNDLVRAPGCVSFAYNNTDTDYNASTIWVNQRCCIACEGPRSKDIPNFFNMLAAQHVTHLVRLTGSYEGWVKKCHPYWDGLIDESQDVAILNIPSENGIYPIRAYHMDHWRDDKGTDPEELLNLALKVKQELDETNGLLVVHCSAGVGRTGTFLATLAIIEAIDQGKPFSIEEIVYRLSLQRVKSVAKLDQYVTLHRVAELYLAKQF